MKKLLITAILMSAFTFANANTTNASINGERVRVGDSYGQIAGKLGQPSNNYDYVKTVNGNVVSVREATYESNGRTYVVTIENGKVTKIQSR
ncbi:DUF2845 domain-containing protein [Acinetobacter sp. FL51]|uniref:DUF2845 domain-containing protein n=1 Tax=Acinetobacter sp. FL51 TaxID=2777978 RepID=UPI0018E14E12|nr:DUF2845 domain-containing protein [Acinetobacter sp. FL51]MBI1453680.1 DUF2845 domain-containing protein [Acinetobacter sp. FL51]